MPLDINYTTLVQFCLKMDQFRVAEKYTDVAIKCDDETFNCHKVILAAASNYFDTMFSGNFRESQQECIPLHDISSQCFKDVLQFMYSGKIQVDCTNVCKLLQADEFLALNGIKNMCERFVQENAHKLAINDVWDIFIFVSSRKNEGLMRLLSYVIMEQLNTFSTHTKFLEISFASLNILLSMRFWNEGNEDRLFNAIIRWVYHDRENRSQYFAELYKKIRIKDVSFGYTLRFLIPKLIVEPNPMVLAETLKPLSGGSGGVSNALPGVQPYLHIFVRCDDTKTEIFSVSCNEKIYFMTSDNMIVSDANRWIRNINVNEFHLYSLQYIRRSPREIMGYYNQSFCVSSSILNMKSSSLSLKSPPIIFEDISWCRVQNSIYAYNQTLSSEHTPNFTNEITFNSEEISRGIYQYNYELDTWFPVPPMVKKQQDSCMLAFYDTLYLLGGAPLNGTSYSQAYDYRSGRWRLLPSTPYIHRGADCCVLNGKIYVVGGSFRVNRYDPVAGKWDEGGSLPVLKKGVKYPRVSSFANKIWSMGNFDEGKPSSDLSIQVYDPHANEWTTSSILINAVQQMYVDKPASDHFILDSVVFKIL